MEQTEDVEPRLTRRRQSSRRFSEESNVSRFTRRQSTSSSHTITGRQRTNSHDIMFEDQTGVMSLSESSWWDESPLLVAVLPCLGAFVFGTEYIQDIILFVCVGWYLHTCIHCTSTTILILKMTKLTHYVTSYSTVVIVRNLASTENATSSRIKYDISTTHCPARPNVPLNRPPHLCPCLTLCRALPHPCNTRLCGCL